MICIKDVNKNGHASFYLAQCYLENYRLFWKWLLSKESGLTQQISKSVYLIKFTYVMFCTLLIRLCKMYCKGILVHHWF